MSTFTYTVSPEIFRDHPGYCRGVVVFTGLDNSAAQPSLTALLRESEAALRSRISGTAERARRAMLTGGRAAY